MITAEQDDIIRVVSRMFGVLFSKLVEKRILTKEEAVQMIISVEKFKE